MIDLSRKKSDMTFRFPTFLDELEARTRISDSLLRVSRGVDRKDWQLVLSAYLEEGTDHHGFVHGSVARDVVPALRVRHESVEHSSHFTGNIAYKFLSATDARVESYGLVMHREQPGADGSVRRLQVAARYVDKFVKSGDDWLIAERVVVWGDVVTTYSGPGFDPPSGHVVQRRDGHDLVEEQEAMDLAP